MHEPLNVGAGRAVMCSTDRAASGRGATLGSVVSAAQPRRGRGHVDRVVDIGRAQAECLDHSPDEVIPHPYC